ncbi:MAG: S24 family peptidase [Planctomycetota bacterium]
MDPTRWRGRELVFWGWVSAGFPSPAQGYEDEPLDLNALLIQRPAATFFYRVRGDHLRHEGIRDGAILVIDRSLTPRAESWVLYDHDGERRIGRMPGLIKAGESIDCWGVITAVVTRF